MHQHRPRLRPSVLRVLLALSTLLLILVSIFAWPVLTAGTQPLYTPTEAQDGTPAATPSPTVTLPPPTTAVSIPSATQPAGPAGVPGYPQLFFPFDRGLILLAMQEGVYSHLFAYRPQDLPFLRLTGGDWNDITPALSPDQRRLAFASDRDGQWDLYLLELESGEVQRLTNTPEYDASPTWSPDGLWLGYESYAGDEESGNLDIFIRPLDGSSDPIRLTDDPAPDRAPAWSPLGRQLAFVSGRSGEDEIWLADLDRVEDRFQNLSRNAAGQEDFPTWMADGRLLTWSSAGADNLQVIYALDVTQPGSAPRRMGSGGRHAWSPGGEALLAELPTPNSAYLTAYASGEGSLALPAVPLSGRLSGLLWADITLPSPLPGAYQAAAQITPTPDWQPALTPAADVPAGRRLVSPLEEVQAPNPYLQDLVDESFAALRRRAAAETGWDFLGSLENAYVPLTSPLAPGMLEDWLYTGRAFAFNPLPIQAGWVVVVREDFGAETYWRVYLRARFQDGSQGAPLDSRPWDFNARYSGDPRAYEQGGALAGEVPPGYWYDFTGLAAAYGWERLPALSTWRNAYMGARFNEFVRREGLDWRSAMLELYPEEALVTPTQPPPPTLPPTATLRPTRTPVPTRTPWPTRTPLPTRTPTANPAARPAADTPAP